MATVNAAIWASACASFLEARVVGRDALFQRIGASVGFAFLLRREGLNYCSIGARR